METVTTAQRRIAALIPVQSATLRGDSAAVCTPTSTVPVKLQKAQNARHAEYMRTGNRSSPDFAPRYFVTYRGVLLAWVRMDGQLRFTEQYELAEGADRSSTQLRTLIRHQRRVMASWPVRFAPFDN